MTDVIQKYADLRVGVIGVGFVGMAHIEALRRLGVQVVAAARGNVERGTAGAVAALPPIAASVDELIDDPSIDAVHVASPNNVHAAQAMRCLAAGKHVICEKPLAVTAAETAELLAAAERSGLVHAVCFNIRFYPLNQHMAAEVAAGALGPPTLLTGSYLQDWLLRDTDWNWRLDEVAGGPLRSVADIGSHWLDLAQFISGQRVVEVMADLHTFVPVRQRPVVEPHTFSGPDPEQASEPVEITNDDAAGILLRFTDGARGVLTVSQVAAGRKNALSLQISGSASSFGWCSEEPDVLWQGHRGQPNQLLQRDGTLMNDAGVAATVLPVGHVEGYADTFRSLFAAVYADVAAGGPSKWPSYPTFADGHDAMLVTEAIARSAGSGRWEPVERGNQA